MRGKRILLLSFLLTISCAHVQPKPVDLVWPLPPEAPKIKYVGTVSTKRDFGLSTWDKILDFILGVDSGIAPAKPWGVTTDPEGLIYVTDTAGTIFVYDREKKSLTFMGDRGQGHVSLPLGIAYDGQGRIWVADGTQKRVVVFDTKTRDAVLSIGKPGEFKRPSGLAVDPRRTRVYVSDSESHNVRAYDYGGKFLYEFGTRGEQPGQFNYPVALAVDSKGNIYVVDQMNFRIQAFDSQGKFLRAFGKVGDRPGMFSRPKGISVDSEDHLYVVDSAFGNIQIFDPTGQLLLFVGQYGSGPGEFDLPAGIHIDGQDRIYVVDQLNRRIQMFQYMKK